MRSLSIRRKFVVAALPLAVLGCGEEAPLTTTDNGPTQTNSEVTTKPVTPKATVSGQVLDTALRPLTEAKVDLTVGGLPLGTSTTTNERGEFAFKDVPGGAQVLLTFSKAGYSTLRANSTTPSSAGNSPLENGNASFGPILLAKLDGTLRFRVIRPDGKPAAGAKTSLMATPAGTVMIANSNNTSESTSNVQVEATADADGLVTIANVPAPATLALLNGQYRIWVSPLDADSDGVPETGGFNTIYAASEFVQSGLTRLISLPSPQTNNTTLNVDGSNVASLRGATNPDPLRNLVRAGEPIYVYFNQPVQEGSILARLTNEYAQESLPVTVTLQDDGYTALLRPGQGVVENGKEYNIFLRAVSRENGTMFTRTGFFFGGDLASSQSVTIASARYQEMKRAPETEAEQLNEGERVYVNFNVPIARTFNGPISVEAMLDADIDGDGTVGNTAGEVGHPSNRGFMLNADEPTGPIATQTPAEIAAFPILQSGYTTRYSFAYTKANGTPLEALDPSQVRLVVAFSVLPTRTAETYESIWGLPVTADLSSSSIGKQAAPAPAP